MKQEQRAALWVTCWAAKAARIAQVCLRSPGGVPVTGTSRRGNHRFTVVVETPTKLTKEQKELLRQLDGTLEETPKRKKFFDSIKDLFD